MEEFITTPPKQILHYMLLEKLEHVLKERRDYLSKTNLGAKGWPINNYTASLDELFMTLFAHLEEAFDKKRFAELQENLLSKDCEKLDDVLKEISRWLKRKRLTDFATKRNYDTTDIEQENFEKGL